MQGNSSRKNWKRSPMKIFKAIVRLVVAGAFAAAEAVLFLDELPIARWWHRKAS